jgi:hypothetical protein
LFGTWVGLSRGPTRPLEQFIIYQQQRESTEEETVELS